MPKFKFGDRVIVNGNKGQVVSVYKDFNGDYTCRVRFDDRNLLPPEMDYPENHVKPDPDDYDYFFGGYYKKAPAYVDTNKYCPVCKTAWAETKFNNKIWYDCNKCKKKKEELVK
jgi:hypothetical protein